MWKKLRTRDKLVSLGILETAVCPLCGLDAETMDHLFFVCPYSKQCCAIIADITNVPVDLTNVETCLASLNAVRGRFRRQVLYSWYVGIMYTIWQERNRAMWQAQVVRPDISMQQLKSDLFVRLKYVMPRKVKCSDRNWCMSLFSSK